MSCAGQWGDQSDIHRWDARGRAVHSASHENGKSNPAPRRSPGSTTCQLWRFKERRSRSEPACNGNPPRSRHRWPTQKSPPACRGSICRRRPQHAPPRGWVEQFESNIILMHNLMELADRRHQLAPSRSMLVPKAISHTRNPTKRAPRIYVKFTMNSLRIHDEFIMSSS